MITIKYLRYCFCRLDTMLDEDRNRFSEEAVLFVNQLKNYENLKEDRKDSLVYALTANTYKRYYSDK